MFVLVIPSVVIFTKNSVVLRALMMNLNDGVLRCIGVRFRAFHPSLIELMTLAFST